ncbi:MAG: EamA-like transporter family protein [Candidatus Izimaplasma bacterium HR2]|nr:MAG: EamA-like transporter family protein [Candidatus Izimaplasma bacterium HR2]
MNRNLARIILTTAGIIWGLGFIGNKYILDSGWNDSQLLFVRFLTATIVIFLIYHKRILNTNIYVIKKGFFLGIFLYLGFLFQTWGLVHTNASNNALITAGYIVLMPIIIYIFERTTIPKKTVFAGAITLLGISLITVDFNELTISFGDSLTFIGAFFYALHIYFLGKLTKKVDLFVLMSFQLLIFSFFATIMMIFRGGLPSVDFSSFDSYKLLILAIIIGFFASFVAFLFQSIGQKNTNEAEAAILISTESLFGPVFAILFYKDPFNLLILFGIIFVSLGIILSETNFIQEYFKKKVKK